MRSGVHASSLPRRFDGEFFLLTYHGAHNRLILRHVGPPHVPEDELDDAPWTYPTVDVGFIGVNSLRMDVMFPDGLTVRQGPVVDDRRVLLLGDAVDGPWVEAREVWWVEADLTANAPSPLLADLDFSVPDFTWERSGWILRTA
ncbi:hypothetical protein J2S43_005304 [Catenuloplanes nepalensis]|uniref:Uncharacterized protein n=1 Tax=Catenuloplanes nepalensis TaxID=587533 RepID=A0ABT9MZC1_9ACTN|nr:hypothetical protein [Catenuloplanes nepalensis]MDP9796792.1 hypothetical protein [Catenuloplanes nepalensis]